MSAPRVKTKLPTGIVARHSRQCRTREGGTCNCSPAYRAWVFDQSIRDENDQRVGGKVMKTFPTLAAAKRWRTDMLSAALERS